MLCHAFSFAPVKDNHSSAFFADPGPFQSTTNAYIKSLLSETTLINIRFGVFHADHMPFAHHCDICPRWTLVLKSLHKGVPRRRNNCNQYKTVNAAANDYANITGLHNFYFSSGAEGDHLTFRLTCIAYIGALCAVRSTKAQSVTIAMSGWSSC